MPASAPRIIRIVAALVTDGRDRVLLVRKRGTQVFMQPGGKLEVGESPVDALVRELHEELGLVLAPARAEYVERARAPAANEPGHVVDADLFRVRLEDREVAVAAAEIEEARWVTVDEALRMNIAPLLRDFALARRVTSP